MLILSMVIGRLDRRRVLAVPLIKQHSVVQFDDSGENPLCRTEIQYNG
jgi:hypothetical protein